jgi:putative ABC transport system substrate-binding protein
MNRRDAIAALGALSAVPLGSDAQQANKVPRIGYLALDLRAFPQVREAFLQELRDVGYVEGHNVLIEYRSAEGKPEKLAALAADLVALKVDVLCAGGGTLPALAAKQATHTLPIVFADAADPVTSGLINNLARPGGNVTGLFALAAELVSKRLELLKQTVPGASWSLSCGNHAGSANARKETC